ncbi:MAG: hypothetical protein JWP53_4230 [Conexibacter sp.]|jgi:hypothetical protein|nr:hypothetical protein [Conexibacter sp.]
MMDGVIARSPARPGLRVPSHARLLVFLPPVLAALLAVPFLIRQNAWIEWSNALWLLQLQAAHVRGTGIPSGFIHLPYETFYPQQALYGGWTFSVLAYPAVVLGAWPVFAFTTVGAFVGIERGTTWFARNLGVARTVAPLLGLAVVATPYVVSDLYGRGAWTELVAFAAAALAFGAGTAVLRAPGRLPLGPAVGLVAAVAVTAGTHNLTLLLAALLAPFILGVAFLGGALTTTWRRLLQAAVLVVAGVGLVALFLLPAVDYGPDTWIAREDVTIIVHNALASYSTAGNLLSPWPRMPKGATGALYAHASLILLLWPIAAAIVLRGRLTRRTGWALALTAVVEIVLFWVLIHPAVWSHFPRAIQTVQFPFRLIPWLGLVGVTAAAVLLRGSAPGRLVASLRVLVGAQVLLALGIAVFTGVAGSGAVHPSDIHASKTPPAFAGWQATQYLVKEKPFGPTPTQPDPAPKTPPDPHPRLVRTDIVPFDRLTADAVPMRGTDPPGTVIISRIAWSPWVRVTGDARIVGRETQGWAVVQVDRAPGGHWTATARAACDTCLNGLKGGTLLSLGLGRLLTILTVLALIGWLGLTWWSRHRTAPRRPHAGRSTTPDQRPGRGRPGPPARPHGGAGR